jgi:hypothetical protein
MMTAFATSIISRCARMPFAEKPKLSVTRKIRHHHQVLKHFSAVTFCPSRQTFLRTENASFFLEKGNKLDFFWFSPRNTDP